MSSLIARWSALPRAARWSALAAAGIAAYFLVIEPALDATASLSARADALQAGVDRRNERARAESEAGRLRSLAAANFGAPALPGRAERSGELNARLEEVFRGRAVGSLAMKARAPVALGRGALEAGLQEIEQAQRLIVDVDFESTPDVATAVLADLERAGEIAAINRIILRKIEKDGKKLVQVSISPEAWVIGPRGGSR